MNDLRQRFEQLRDEERAVVPRFFIPSAPRRTKSFAVPALLLVIVAMMMLFMRNDGFSANDRVAARAITEWRAPTDFLLRTPGREVLNTTPSIPSKGVIR